MRAELDRCRARCGGQDREADKPDAIANPIAATDVVLELHQVLNVDLKVPVQPRAHLALHLVDLLEREQAAVGFTPNIILADYIGRRLGRNQECRQKQPRARSAPRIGSQSRSKPVKKEECREQH